MTDLSQVIQRLSPEKRRLLERRLRAQGVELAQAVILPARREEAPLPLSFAQQRLFFLDRLVGDSPLYNVAMAIRLAGPLDAAALGRAFAEVVRRHESLRTRFDAVDGEPVQTIEPPDGCDGLCVVDLRLLDAGAREKDLRRLAAETERRPFSLARGRLLRSVLVRLADLDQALLLTTHHIVSDAWSMELLIGELVTLYAAFAAGLPSPLPEPTLHYADFALWQRRALAGAVLERQLSYWRTQLAGLPALDLPADRPRPPIPSFAGARVSVSAAGAPALQALGRRLDATPFIVLLAALQTLLLRYTARTDVAVCSPVAGRNRPEVENLIGFFVNTLVLRVDLSGNPGFAALVGRAREVTLQAHAHQDLPFEKLVSELQPRRDMSRQPFSQVVLRVGARALRPPPQPAGLALSPLPAGRVAAKCDLELDLRVLAERVAGELIFAVDLFDRSTTQRLAGHLEVLLAGIAADPARTLAELPLLAESETHQVLEEWSTAAGDLSVVVDPAGNPVPIGVPGELCVAVPASAEGAAAAGSSVVKGGVRLARTGDLARWRADGRLELIGRLAAGAAAAPAGGAAREGPPGGQGAAARLLATEEPGAAPRTATEKILAEIWSGVLRRGGFGIHDNFFELGGDSILTLQVVARARQAGLRLTSRQMFGNPTIAGLAQVATALTAVEAEPGVGGGPVPLTPIQHSFLALRLPRPAHFNQALLLEAAGPQPLPPALLARAVEHLARHHDALRMRFATAAPGSSAWRQSYGRALPPSLLVQLDLAALPEARQRAVLEAAAARLQASLDLGAGRVLRAGLFTLGAGRADRLLLIIHHFVVDGVSWRILLEDLTALCGQLARREEPALPAKTSSFSRWAERLAAHAAGAEIRAQGEYWAQRSAGPFPELAADHDRGPNTAASARSVVVSLDAEATRALLEDVPRAYRTRIEDVLLTALVKAAADRTGSRRLLLELESHGREELFADVDVARTVGCFTAVFPVVLETGEEASPAADLKSIKEQLRAVPGRGLAFGLLCHLGPEGPAGGVRAWPAAEVIFNYLGQLDQALDPAAPFRPAPESAGPTRDGGQPRGHLLEISSGIAGGCLRMVWIYSVNRHRRSTIEDLAQRFLAALRGLIAHCASGEAGGYTPSDFPLAGLDQPALDRLAAALGGAVEDLYPASPCQQGMLFHTLHSPGSGVYVEQLSLSMQVALDAPAFERAWEMLVERHAILRSAFVWSDLATPLQAVAPRVRLPWDHRDWRDLSANEQKARLAAYLEEDRRRGFDLALAPLLRCALFRLGEESYQFVWTHHHILLDGWSMPILLAELLAIYEAVHLDETAKLGRPRPFRDYIAWLAGQDLAAAEELWRRALAGFTAPTPLPLERLAAPPPGGARQAAAALALPEDASDRLRSLAQRHQVTLNTVVQGAWALLLHLYSGEEDVVFGAVTAGRSAPLPGIEAIVGPFLNTLPARILVAPRSELGSWLQAIQAGQAEVRQYEHSPLAAVQGWSAVPRGQPLFESILAFENCPLDETTRARAGASWRLGGLEAVEQTNYALAIVAGPGPRLGLKVLYDPLRFTRPAVQRLLGHLANLLAAMGAGGEQSLAALPLLGAAERQQLVREWNATSAPGTESTLVALFEEQVERAAERPAVLAGPHRASYLELNGRANRLAHLLRRLGCGPGDLVALLLERSAEMIPALLGILKSGAAYVPLETSYPPARLHWILEAMAVRVLVAAPAQLARLAELPAELGALHHLVCLEEPDGPVPLAAGRRLWRPAELDGLPDRNPPRHAGPDDLAYVIFTSGSTGTPKGVAVRHRPVVNLIDWVNRTFAVGPADRVLFVTSLCFDLSVYDVFGILAAGGSIRVASRQEVEDPEALACILAAEPITFWDSAPAALQRLAPWLPRAAAPGGGEAGSPALRLVFLSGDWIPLPLAQQVRASFPAARLIALGGATEATVWSNFYPVHEIDPGWPSIPYGRPIQNARYYVLDGRLEPCPIGIAGDLYIGGPCLATGYARAADRTASRFVPDPLAELAGAVMYRTGDRARFLADGNVEFLGRLDHQVKIRGFRIELGEIEAALAQHPAVAEALVLAREDRPGDKALAAYVVPRLGDGQAPPPPQELRRHLEQRLPDYMVPPAYVVLAALPLTANGKVDRKALPAPARAATDADTAPRGPFEELLAGLFAEVLAVDRVGREDSFFALGGHSLLATQLVSRLRQAFAVEVALASLFESPTVAELAAVVGSALAGREGAAAPALQRVPRGAPLPLSFGQERLWFFDQLAPGSSVYNIPSAFVLKGALAPAALALACDEIVRRHEILRTTFVTQGGEPLQVVGAARRQALPLVDLQALAEARWEAEARRLTGEEGRRPFDLRRGPLLRVTLLRLAAEAHAVLATMHHIASDGWSQGILLGELAALYEAAVQGERSPLPELPVQYADFAQWQRRWLASGVLARELGYWREKLRDLPPALALPSDRPRPDEQSFRGALAGRRLGEPLAAGLRALARGQRATLFMVLLAAIKLLLHRLSGQVDVLIGTPVAGRERAELEGLIGFFLNTLVLRTSLAGDPSFLDLLGRVRTSALEAYAHQAVPFEKLLLELRPQRDLGRTPLFQILFNMLNLPQPKLGRSTLRLESLPVQAGDANFDMTIYAAEGGAGIVLNLAYNADLFDRPRVEAILDQLVVLLEQIAEHPGQPIGRFSLVTASARRLLPHPGAALSEPSFEPVSRLFLAQARGLPDRPAVCAADRTWTYAELAARALALGGELAARGIRAGEVVALAGPRCPELIAGVLAILLRGGVLLTLDRKLPEARQRAMLAQARAVCLLYAGGPRAEDGWMWRLPGIEVLPAAARAAGAPGAATAAASADVPLLARLDEACRLPGAAPDDPAYVFFTSGTTGEPKGILGRQKSLGHFLAWQRETFGIGAGDRVAQLTGLSFDVVLRDLLLPLTSGAALCLPDDDDLGPERILGWLETQAVTVLHTVPSLASLWLGRARPPARPGTLRWVFFAGEPLPDRLVGKWRETFPRGGVVNLYGPTETTLAKCFYRVPDPPPSGVQPVGSPLPQTQALVLARTSHPAGEERLCGVGEPGEIVLRTPFRSLGYLTDPGDEPPRFRANPWGQNGEQDLLYFTGDRGRYRPDGVLEILGRLDEQVKIRGMRVEPAEIAAVLSRQPSVRESVVLAKEGPASESSLVAYVVPREGAAGSVAELRRALAEQLPDYMVPGAFVTLEAMPLTANGKLDRAALPAPAASRSESLDRWLPPRDRHELELVRLWEELLSVRPIGVRDNFFALGGHSLMLLRLRADIEERFGRSLALAELLRGPTVEKMAAALREEAGSGPPSPLVPLRQGGALPPLFCVHPAGGLVLGYQELADHLGPEAPFYGLQARGIESDEEPHTRVEEMARFYLEAVRAVRPHGPYHLAGWSFGGRVAFEMAQQLVAEGEEVALLALLDAAAPAEHPQRRDFEDMAEFFAYVAREAGLAVTAGELRALDHDAQLRHLADLAVRADLLPQRTAAVSYLRRRAAVYRGNVVAGSTYAARPYPGRITFFAASEPWGEAAGDGHVGHGADDGDGADGGTAAADRGAEWRRWSAQGVTVERVPGNHRTMIREPHVAVLAEALRRALAAGAAGHGAGSS